MAGMMMISEESRKFIFAHGPILVLGFLVLIQWIVMQALILHYYFFRKSLKRPQPDLLRIHMIEKTVAFQSEQMESIFKKLNDFRKELNDFEKRPSHPVREEHGSMEKTFMSLGELSLKKRINEMLLSNNANSSAAEDSSMTRIESRMN